MRFIIACIKFVVVCIMCLISAAFLLLSQAPQDAVAQTSTSLDIDQLEPPNQRSENRNKDWKIEISEAEIELMSLGLQIREARRRLRHVQLETTMRQKRKILYKKAPFPWSSEKCEEVRYHPHQVDRCLWAVANHEGTHVCESWWLVEASTWRLDSKIQCHKSPVDSGIRACSDCPLANQKGWKGI